MRVAAAVIAGVVVAASTTAPSDYPTWQDTRTGALYGPPGAREPSLPYGRVTAYCHCERCCAKADGITASGVPVAEGVTAAADVRIFPMGSCITIDGLGRRIVQDVGSGVKGLHVDVYFASHEDALAFGSKFLRIERCKEGGYK